MTEQDLKSEHKVMQVAGDLKADDEVVEKEEECDDEVVEKEEECDDSTEMEVSGNGGKEEGSQGFR